MHCVTQAIAELSYAVVRVREKFAYVLPVFILDTTLQTLELVVRGERVSVLHSLAGCSPSSCQCFFTIPSSVLVSTHWRCYRVEGWGGAKVYGRKAQNQIVRLDDSRRALRFWSYAIHLKLS